MQALRGQDAMPTIQIADDKKYGKAIGILLELGGVFRTKPTRQLVVGAGQLQVLQAAGLVPKSNGVRKRGQKNSKTSQSSRELTTPK
jgi:hypothetical protein